MDTDYYQTAMDTLKHSYSWTGSINTSLMVSKTASILLRWLTQVLRDHSNKAFDVELKKMRTPEQFGTKLLKSYLPLSVFLCTL
jgi:hypothetical protein